MCGVIFTWWVGRHNNGPITGSNSNVRGSAINTRVVKLQPLQKQEGEAKEGGGLVEKERSGSDKNGVGGTSTT